MATILQIVLTLFVSFVSLFIGVFYGEKIGSVFGMKVCAKIEPQPQQTQEVISQQQPTLQPINIINSQPDQINPQPQVQIATTPQQQYSNVNNQQAPTVAATPDVKIKINQVESRPNDNDLSPINESNKDQQKIHPININVDINQNAGVQQQKPDTEQQLKPNTSSAQQNSPKLSLPQLKK